MSVFLADAHTHSRFSEDGQSALPAMAEAALRAGLSALTVTDHYDTWSVFDAAAHRAAFAEAKEAFADRLLLLRGAELGEGHMPGAPADALLDGDSFDFLLGSCHFISGRQDFYSFDYADVPSCRALIADYLSELLAMIRWGRFDVLGHLTYPLRYMAGRDGVDVDFLSFTDELRAVFRALIDGGHGLEVNVSGLCAPGGFAMPDAPLLKLYRACGGEIVTVGSDAHRAEDVGAHISDGYALLREAGFTHVAVYRDRKPKFFAL